MGGYFGVASKSDCLQDLFYGTDYHSHLGTKRGGLVVVNGNRFIRYIHSIESAQFRSKFETDLPKMKGNVGIGVISDSDDQPVLIKSHLGTYAIVSVGVVRNLRQLADSILSQKGLHFSELRAGEINMTELIAMIINLEADFASGILRVWELIDGSCSLLILTQRGIIAARDKWGRTPLIIGQKNGAHAATFETCAFPNLDYSPIRDLGPGEIIFLTDDGYEQLHRPFDRTQICGFLWIYYGYPASTYEGRNVESVRNNCGRLLARHDEIAIDLVTGIPDSGVGHGLGYAAEANIPFRRPFVKYSTTWARSFMPQEQEQRELIARMKLVPVKEIIEGKRLLFCEDSIVRGTQLRDTIQRLFDYGALEVHMRPACPPLVFACPFLNFSRSKSELDLAARKAILALEGKPDAYLNEYASDKTDRYRNMVDRVRKHLNLTSLKYQSMANMVEAIGLPKEKLCTYCWDGVRVPELKVVD